MTGWVISSLACLIAVAGFMAVQLARRRARAVAAADSESSAARERARAAAKRKDDTGIQSELQEQIRRGRKL